MFNIGMSEMILIFIVALIVFGPDKLPEIARTLGKSARELKKAGDDLVEAATDTKRAADIEVVGVRESLSKFKEAQAMMKD
ncbi:twin-arginine translocase TatA/TatE family subunit, partial [Anaeroglobus geminatus]